MPIVNDLEMAKNHFEKINITNVAIEKVPFIKYDGLTEKQCLVIQALAKEVLLISKEENDCNEVAITYKLVDDCVEEEPDYGVALGDEHSVELEADPYSNHLLQTTREVAIVILHNHPSPQSLSYDDLSTFILYRNIKMIIAVTNQGAVHYIIKGKNYDFGEARKLMVEYAKLIENAETNEVSYKLTKKLIKEFKQMGIIY